MKRSISLSIILLFLMGCTESTYQLKWKINKGDRIIYLTQLEIQKDKSYMSDENNFTKFAEAVMKLKGDTLKIPDISGFYNEMIEQNNNVEYFSLLEPEGDNISLEILGKRKKILSQPKYPVNDFIPAESVFFSGTITNAGNIQENGKSFIQNYFTNIMFELPKTEISIGDSWPLDIKLYDFSKKPGINKVTLVDVVTQGEDEIAVLEYKIKSGSNTQSMLIGSIDYTGNAEFNITEGRWESFQGILVNSSIGFTEMKQTQKISLSEISETDYNQFIERYKKANLARNEEEKNTEIVQVTDNESINNIKKELKLPVKKTGNTQNNKVQSNDCPVKYCVQILATDEPIPLNSKEFKGLNYKIEQRYIASQPKFKYKYVVGNECSLSEARELEKKIKQEGFPGAFIVKK